MRIRFGLPKFATVVAFIGGSMATAMILSGSALNAQDQKVTLKELKQPTLERIDYLEVKSLTLTDRMGRTRAWLHLHDDDHTPTLAFYDAEGRERVSIVHTPEGDPGIRFLDRDEKTRLGIYVSPDGSPSLLMQYHDEKEGLSFGINDNSRPGLTLFDKEGHPVIGLAVTDRGYGLQIHSDDERGAERIFLGVNGGGLESGLEVFDKESQQRAVVGLVKEGVELIRLFSPKGEIGFDSRKTRD